MVAISENLNVRLLASDGIPSTYRGRGLGLFRTGSGNMQVALYAWIYVIVDIACLRPTIPSSPIIMQSNRFPMPINHEVEAAV